MGFFIVKWPAILELRTGYFMVKWPIVLGYLGFQVRRPLNRDRKALNGGTYLDLDHLPPLGVLWSLFGSIQSLLEGRVGGYFGWEAGFLRGRLRFGAGFPQGCSSGLRAKLNRAQGLYLRGQNQWPSIMSYLSSF